MKKAICMVLIFTLLFTIIACGNSKEKQSHDMKPEVSVSGTIWADAKTEQAGEIGADVGTEIGAESGAENGTDLGAESGEKSGAVLNGEVQTELQSAESTKESKEQTESSQAGKRPVTEQEIDKGESLQGSTDKEATQMKMKIKVGNKVFTATLAENSSVDALKKLMADGPLTLNMSDYANMEKGADLGVTLPQNNIHMNTQAGDIILYQGRTFVIYYDTNSWSLTPIGKIDNVNAKELRAALGTGDVTVVLSIE